MSLMITIAALLFGASLSHAAALELRQDRPSCTADACGNAFTRAPGMPRAQSASSFCSSYVTAAPADTITTTSTTTIPAGLVTITASPAVTTTVTAYACPVPLKKRDDAITPTWASACSATGTVRSEQRLSSACSCMGITARPSDPVTTTVATTSTGPISTTTVTPTITSTVVNPWNPAPTNLIQNPGFEDGLSHWSYQLTDPAYSYFQIATPGQDSNETVQIDLKSPGGVHGPMYGNAARLIQDIPPIHGDYDYRFKMSYRFLKYDRSQWSCRASLNASSTYLGETQIWPGTDNTWSGLVFSRQASTSNPARVYGPLILSVGCTWSLDQSPGTLMDTIQIDNLEWVPYAGCHPM